MSKTFVDAMKQEQNWKKTENNADALLSSESDVLDLFSTGGVLRGRTPEDIQVKVSRAWDEDPEKTLKTLFYLRDIRGGQGERRTFKIAMKHLANIQKTKIKHLLPLIGEIYGRWDDLYTFVGTPLEKDALDTLKSQFEKDLKNLRKGEEVSLVGKWLKGLGSKNESLGLAIKTRKHFGLTNAEYRKNLKLLREKIKLIETQLSEKETEGIDFEKVPSLAMQKYRNAFAKLEPEKFEKYLESVEKGEKKINASALFPYDPVRKMLGNGKQPRHDAVAEAQWKALPDYVKGENSAIAVVDISESMTWAAQQTVRPLDISISLGIYLAERNHGPFKNKLITFSANPKFVELKGETLYEKISEIPTYYENTDIEKVMDLILKVATEHNLDQEQLPKSIVLISDMEFDEGSSNHRQTYQELFVEKFKNAGYKAPIVVYWNANARNDTFHTRKDSKNTILVGGASPSIMQSVLSVFEGKTPYDFMLEIIMSERYEPVKL